MSIRGQRAAQPLPVRGAGKPGRADLFRALALAGDDGLAAAARVLGFERTAEPEEAPRVPRGRRSARPRASRRQEPAGSRLEIEPIPFWRVVAAEAPEPRAKDDKAEPWPELTEEMVTPPADRGQLRAPPIVAWPRLWRVLDPWLRSPRPRRALDVDRLVDQLGRGRPLRRLPRLQGSARGRVTVIVDLSPRLTAFWQDQIDVAARLAGYFDAESFRCLWLADSPVEARIRALEGEVVLALSDLGFLADASARNVWARQARQYRRAGAKLCGLAPCAPVDWVSPLAELWGARNWARPHQAGRSAPRREGGSAETVRDQLLGLLSPALRIEPGLVRSLRQLVPGADLRTEVEIWRHPEVDTELATLWQLDPVAARRRHRDFGVGLSSWVRDEAARRILAWHRAFAPEELGEVRVNLLDCGVSEEIVAEVDLGAFHDLFRHAVGTLESGSAGEALPEATEVWYRAFRDRVPAGLWKSRRFREPLLRAEAALRRRGAGELQLPAGVTPDMLPPANPEAAARRFALWHEADKLRLRLAGEPGQGSPLAEIWARERVTLADGIEPARELGLRRDAPAIEWPRGAGALELVSDVETVRLEQLTLPGWASAIGRDEYGLWAAFEVEGVEQRMRWIAPGRFWMGSPESEAGRWEGERPRHEVVLTEGFWLAETPCTQALWEAVMGSNPSRFKGVERPVESVSWDDCESFLKKLNQGPQTPDFRLPTEAQWEYACRAGTETATWREGLASLGESAWYDENSGGETKLVGLKPANPWGLYDMLGNVWEWCSDQRGAERILRGGSWTTVALGVRAATRGWPLPAGRDGDLGFRLSRGREHSE